MEEDPILKNIENAPGDTPEEKPAADPAENVPEETPAEEPKTEEPKPEEPAEEAPAAEEPPIEPVAEASVEEVKPEETTAEPEAKPEEPAEEPKTEEPKPEEPAEEAPVEPAVSDATPEKEPEDIPVSDNTAEEKPAVEEPAVHSSEDLIAAAEAETPAATAPGVFDKPKKKSKAGLIVLIILFILLAGCIAVYFLLPDVANDVIQKITGTSQTAETKKDQTPAEPGVKTQEKLRLAGNDLSDFDLSFLGLENKQENIIYSPLSIKYALAMLKDGAAGNSKTQIEALIGDYSPKAYLNSENRSLANAMVISNRYASQVKSSYTDTLKSKYNAEVILDSFLTPDVPNNWVSDKTLGIINNMFDETTVNTDLNYMLVNALAIDMKWNNQFQCAFGEDPDQNIPCKYYNVHYAHEKYGAYISQVWSLDDFEKNTFNGKEGVSAAKIGASINRYDIVKELGEDYIRSTVQAEYEKWAKEHDAPIQYEDMETYMTELSGNYGLSKASTDFSFSDSDTERIIVKDLQEYDGSTLQYVAIMPKGASLNSYISDLTAEKTTTLIAGVHDADDVNSYKDGVVTKVTGFVPFFKFSYTMDDLITNLEKLGITDIFSPDTADLLKSLL